MSKRLLQAYRDGMMLKPRLGYMTNFHDDFYMDFHRHNTVEIMYACDGDFACDVVCGEEIRHLTVHPHGCLLLNNAVKHRLVITKPVKIVNLEFEMVKDSAGAFRMDGLYENVAGFRLLLDDNPDYVVFSGCDEAYTIMRSVLNIIVDITKRTGDVNYRQALLSEAFFAELTCQYQNSTLEFTQGRYIEAVKQYITQNITEKLTLEELARVVSLHPNYLERIFKQNEHCTIIQYINRQRILNAAHLLHTATISIEEVAYAVGFSNRQYFSKMFRQQMRVSPAEYRQKFSAKNYDDADVDECMIIEQPTGTSRADV